MSLANMTRWLLVAVFLTSCSGGVELPAAETRAELEVATVAATTAAPATAAPTAQPHATTIEYGGWVNAFTTKHGDFDENPTFWATISPNSYLEDLSGPIQLHHSTTDEMVPVEWAETLAQELENVNQQPYELDTYPGDNYNISANFGVAMQRTVAFFDEYVKAQ